MGLSILCACSSAVEPNQAPKEDVGASVAAVSGHPDPIASITLGDEHVIEFYNIGGGALVTESLTARTPSTLRAIDDLLRANRLTDAFSLLSPGTPVPQALIDLEVMVRAAQPYLAAMRAANASAPSSGASDSVRSGERSENAGSSQASFAQGRLLTDTASPNVVEHVNACSNICCDKEWLKANVCPHAANDTPWFLPDLGWETVSTDGISFVQAAECAGIGTSDWVWYTTSPCGGISYNWAVKEGTALTATYSPGFCLWGGTNWGSAINSKADPHLNTFCGVDSH
jgi:hypothetical protein